MYVREGWLILSLYVRTGGMAYTDAYADLLREENTVRSLKSTVVRGKYYLFAEILLILMLILSSSE
jgi:hypothetical protein